MAAQASNEGLGLPMAKGHVIIKPFTYWCPASAFGQFRVGRSFINENKAVNIPAHEGRAPVDPHSAGLLDIKTFLFAGDECFFYY